MKCLLSKEHYYCKIHTLIKNVTHPVYGLPAHIYKKIFIPPSMIFQKFQPLYK